jgi:phospholipid/cholesterol/gamma-HCH transport system substrate-binding protein
MNKSSKRELRDVAVGLGVVILVVGILVVVFGPPRTTDGSTIDVSAVFGRADGLQIGNPVHAAGVQVGKVANLELVQQFRVRATLRIDKAIELDSDATAAIITDGIFGGKVVQVDIGGGEQMIGDGGRISYTEDAIVLDDLLGIIISQAKSAQEAGAKQ